MAKKISYNMTCPYCNEKCDSWRDEFTLTRRRTMQYFHKSCYNLNTMKNKK